MQGAATQAMWWHRRGAATQQMSARRRAPQGCWLSGLQDPMPHFRKMRKPGRQQQNAKLFLREPLATGGRNMSKNKAQVHGRIAPGLLSSLPGNP
jgi:hypothetical protein